jgi:hypothetical protein
MLRTITITTFPATRQRELDPLVGVFSGQVTELCTQTQCTPPLLMAQPGMITLQAKVAAAAQALLGCVASDGHPAHSLTVTLVLAEDAAQPGDDFTCRCGMPLLTEIQRITGECPGCAAESAERDALALEHLDEEGR